jgi:hypothetical protein
MTDQVARWVQLYRTAWESNRPDDIRAAFTEDAVYLDGPSNPNPLVGHAAIVAGWLDAQDAPGTTTFEWEPLAQQGDLVVLRCVTGYPDRTYDNLWVVRLAPDGRACQYTDWYVRRP